MYVHHCCLSLKLNCNNPGNWVANKLWVDELDWSGKKEYNEAQWEDWFVGDSKAGEIKQTPLLTFATIRGAGHMISAGPPVFLGLY